MKNVMRFRPNGRGEVESDRYDASSYTLTGFESHSTTVADQMHFHQMYYVCNLCFAKRKHFAERRLEGEGAREGRSRYTHSKSLEENRLSGIASKRIPGAKDKN